MIAAVLRALAVAASLMPLPSVPADDEPCGSGFCCANCDRPSTSGNWCIGCHASSEADCDGTWLPCGPTECYSGEDICDVGVGYNECCVTPGA